MPVASKDETSARDRYMTVQQAAAALGISRFLLLKRAASGEIATEEVAGRLVVLRESVERARAAASAA
jgi:excisionase family DNA binding protein